MSLGIERRIQDDLHSVAQAANVIGVRNGARQDVLEDLKAVERGLSTLPHPEEKGFRAILPLSTLHQQIFKAQAKLWQAMGIPALMVWSSDIWAPLSHIKPPMPEGKPILEISMMQNEYRAGALNLSLATDNPLAINLQITGLPGGTNPPYITVNEVPWTDTRSGIPVAAALQKVMEKESAFPISVSPGLTRQVWFTFHPTNVPPGVYAGNIVIAAPSTNISVPITFHIYPLRFPDVPTLHVGGWDYTDSESYREITPLNRDDLIAHLRDHFVDSPWATSSILSSGNYAAAGKIIRDPDTLRFDQWVAKWHNARQYCVFANVKAQFEGSRMDTPEFHCKVDAWITFWAQHAQRLGLKPQQLILLLVDEPSKPEEDAIILAWAKTIRAANTGVRIWEDPCHKNPLSANQQMMAAYDVICPNRPTFIGSGKGYRNYFLRQHEQGAELAFYSCQGPAPLLDPYSYYRLQAWSCWQYGAQSSYFWAFSDGGGGSSWNEYAAKGSTYVPFFLDARSVTPAKQMEALREGVEDYEYLVMLRDKIARAEKSGVHGSILDRAKMLLREAPLRVCDAPGASDFKWADEKDCTIADKVRVEILDALMALP